MVLSIVPVEFIGSFCGNCLHVVSFRGIWGFVWELRLDSLVRFCCVIDLKGNDGGIEKELWRVCRSIPISLGKWAVLAGSVRNWKNSYFSVLGHCWTYWIDFNKNSSFHKTVVFHRGKDCFEIDIQFVINIRMRNNRQHWYNHQSIYSMIHTPKSLKRYE